VVCPGASRASAVISASREARAVGVRTLMRVPRGAAALSRPRAAGGRTRPSTGMVSRRLLELLDSYSPRVLPLVDRRGGRRPVRGRRPCAATCGSWAWRSSGGCANEVGDWLTVLGRPSPTNVLPGQAGGRAGQADGLRVIDHRNLEEVPRGPAAHRPDGTSRRATPRASCARAYRTPLHLLRGQPAHAAQPGLRLGRRGRVVPAAARLRDGVVRGARAQERSATPTCCPRPVDDLRRFARCDPCVLRPAGPPAATGGPGSRAGLELVARMEGWGVPATTTAGRAAWCDAGPVRGGAAALGGDARGGARCASWAWR